MASFSRSLHDMEIDPKLAWALEHREQFPVDLNRAPREILHRIPGLGERAVDRIVQMRRRGPIGAADVRKLRVNWHQVRYFVATIDHCPRQTVPEKRPTAPRVNIAPLSQLPLFDGASIR